MMTNKTPVMLPLTKQPRPVQWAIAFHAWLLTWLPASYPDRDVIAVTFEEQCLEAYQVGLGWWFDVVIWAWGDVGITAGLTRFSEFRQMLGKEKDLENEEYLTFTPGLKLVLALILSIISISNIILSSFSSIIIISIISIIISSISIISIIFLIFRKIVEKS